MKPTYKRSLKKKALLALILLFAATFAKKSAQAQDTLHFRNGNQQIAKILEITPTVVKYKKQENMEGPT